MRRLVQKILLLWFLGVIGGGMMGCVGNYASPNAVEAGVLADEKAARVELRKFEAQKVKLRRPVMILAGLGDVGFHANLCRNELAERAEGERLVVVSFFGVDDLRKCAVRAIKRAQLECGEGVEVDVIGISMGGVVARLAAEDAAVAKEAGASLKIRRLFTMASPLQGAKMAKLPALSRIHGQLRPGSELLTELSAREPDYEVLSYVRRGDGVVGEGRASLPGRQAMVVATPLFQGAHWGVITDERVVLDVLRRLGQE